MIDRRNFALGAGTLLLGASALAGCSIRSIRLRPADEAVLTMLGEVAIQWAN